MRRPKGHGLNPHFLHQAHKIVADERSKRLYKLPFIPITMVYWVEQEFNRLLSLADVKINGSRPWDMQVHDKRLYNRLLTSGSMGLGESYVDGWWDCKKLDELFYRILHAELDGKFRINAGIILQSIKSRLFNLQSSKKAFEVGEKHYDIGNDLFTSMLDKRLTYTCGYWKNARNLDKAQEAKLDLVCKKLKLKPGQKVLDIGCGWGSFMKFAAEKYKVKCVGFSISREQTELGRKLCKGLPIEFRLQDYREINEKFDHIVSLGMFEHVGPKNYIKYMQVANSCLKDDGLFLLHTIGSAEIKKIADPWIEKYIFPNGYIPDMKNISESIDRLFVMEDWHNFGAYYDPTLMAWFNNFEKNWNKLKDNYNERFHRMWRYYLLSCAGAFRARKIQLWQIVLSKKGVPGGYISVR